MQASSSQFDDAVEGSGRMWAPARIRTDWAVDDYDGDGTIDDLTNQAGDWSVEHHLDDGYPDAVSFVSGLGSPELDVELGGREGQHAARYFSPFNASSPLAGFDRDVAPVTLEVGAVTANGVERVTVFTGQMMDTRVRGGKANLSALSGARLKLAKLVQPPAVGRNRRGLNSSWPISWTLQECGLLLSPPPREGCRWWVPMHGSTREFIPGDNEVQPILGDEVQYNIYRVTAAGLIYTEEDGPGFVDGPYLLGADAYLTTAESKRVTHSNIRFGAGEDFLSLANNKGRIEFWVRGDAADFNTAPGGSGTVSRLCGMELKDSGVGCRVLFGLDTARRASVTVYDGSTTTTLTSLDTLPTDGEWYFVGAAYDINGDKLWVTNFDGTTRTSSPAFTNANLLAADSFVLPWPTFVSYLPVAEVQVTSGARASVDVYPQWLNQITFTPDVIMTPSILELQALVEAEPSEAWELISRYAQAELATMRVDELDRFLYLGLRWWVKPEQQIVGGALTTDTNMGMIDVNQDPSKIRNAVRVSYSEVATDFYHASAHQVTNQERVIIEPGVTTVRFAMRDPVFKVPGEINVFGSADFVTFGAYIVDQTYITLNESPDGVGTYATPVQASVELIEWDAGSVTWRITNSTLVTWYIAVDSTIADGAPPLNIIGLRAQFTSAFAVDIDTDSVAARGERALPVGMATIQSRIDARRLAGHLKMALRRPVPVIDQTTVAGDPRRQPGDLVEISDTLTGVSGALWRLQTVDHAGMGAKYVNKVRVRTVKPPGVWGVSTWGNALWQEGSS